MHACLWHLELQMLSSCPPGSSWCCWALPPSPSQTHLHWRTRSPPSGTLWSASSSDPESRWEEYPAHPQNWEEQAENTDLSYLSRALRGALKMFTFVCLHVYTYLNECVLLRTCLGLLPRHLALQFHMNHNHLFDSFFPSKNQRK